MKIGDLVKLARDNNNNTLGIIVDYDAQNFVYKVKWITKNVLYFCPPYNLPINIRKVS